MSLTFHLTFSLDLGNISRLMEAVKNNPSISDKQIQYETGMGNKKVDPTIKYATYCDLIRRYEPSKELIITEFGKILTEFDEYLVSPVTHFALHYKISNKVNGAPAWSYFIYDFLPKHNEFNRASLKIGLDTLDPSLSQPSKDKNVAPLLNTYLKNEGLYKVKIIEESNKDFYTRTTFNYPNIYSAAYILAELWEDHYKNNRISISHTTLFNDGYFGAVMNLSDEEIQKCLNEMTAIGLIQQDREAPPYQIVKRWDEKYSLLKKALRPN